MKRVAKIKAIRAEMRRDKSDSERQLDQTCELLNQALLRLEEEFRKIREEMFTKKDGQQLMDRIDAWVQRLKAYD